MINRLNAIPNKLRKSLRIRGLLGTTKFLAVATIKWVRDRGPRGRLTRELRRAVDDDFDRQFGLDTGGVISLSDLDVTATDNWVFGVQYQPIGAAAEVRDVLEGLEIEHREFTFIDLG